MAMKPATALCRTVCGELIPAAISRAATALGRASHTGRSAARTAVASLSEGERLLEHEAKVMRQPLVNRFIHWGVAISSLALFFSGFGQMPLYKRYMVSDLPGLAWTADFGATLAIHYVAAIVLILAASFHVAYHGLRRELGFLPRRGDLRESYHIIKAMILGGKEPPAEKYLAEQRLAYAAIGGSILILIGTGMVKVAKNLQGVEMNAVLIAASTHLHNLAMALLLVAVVGHLLAFVIPANRRLIPGILHGKVDLEYALHRHCLWCERLVPQKAPSRSDRARGRIST